MKKLQLLMMTLMPLMALADKQIVDGIEWIYTVKDGQATVGSGECAAIPTTTAGAIWTRCIHKLLQA